MEGRRSEFGLRNFGSQTLAAILEERAETNTGRGSKTRCRVSVQLCMWDVVICQCRPLTGSPVRVKRVMICWGCSLVRIDTEGACVDKDAWLLLVGEDVDSNGRPAWTGPISREWHL